MIEIFFCYAHEDEHLRKGLELQLRGLARQGLISMWHDREISPGTEWEQKSYEHLNSAQIILLLISPDFIASDYCYGKEMERAIERHEQNEAIVIPVILRPVFWQNTPFGKLQSLPTGAKYVTSSSWFNQDEAFFDVAEGIRRAIEKSDKEQTATSREGIKATSQNLGLGLRNDEQKEHTVFTEDLKRLCPSCIEEFYPGDCLVISQITEEVLKSAPTGWMTKQLARRKPEPLTSPEYLNKQACRVCPHCHYHLPYNIEIAENISIAVVGDVASGKTTYIASLLHQLEEMWMKDNSKFIQVKCLNERFKRYHISEFLQRRVLSLTQPSLYDNRYEPIIYELKFRGPSDRSYKRINLIFYDGSGEDQSDVIRMEHCARYVLYANAIIFLIDPLYIPEVFNRLPEHIRYNWSDQFSNRAYHLVSSTIELFKTYYGSKANNRLRSIPIAMMLSKSDILKYIAPTAPSYRFLSSCRYANTIDLQEIRAVDKEVRAFIGDSHERIILKVAQKFSNVNFFATSATGCIASKEDHLYPFIDPCRCLDPLLWILYQFHIIPAQ